CLSYTRRRLPFLNLNVLFQADSPHLKAKRSGRQKKKYSCLGCVYVRVCVCVCSGVWRWCSGVCSGVWRWCSGVWRCVVVCGGGGVGGGGGGEGGGGGVRAGV